MSQSRAPSAETLELLDKQLGRYEAVIQRLAGYSAQAKTWCVTLVAAIAALAANNERPTILGLGVVAAVGFLFLDAYYLSLERHFRGAADALVDEAGADQAFDWSKFFKLEQPSDRRGSAVLAAIPSLAISPFYAMVACLLLLGFFVSA